MIQKISRHKTLSALQKYLEVLDEDLESAVSTLKFWDVSALVSRKRVIQEIPGHNALSDFAALSGVDKRFVVIKWKVIPRKLTNKGF